MATDYSKDLFAREGDAGRITLGFAEDLFQYTPIVSESIVAELAEEYGVSTERILAALKKWWFETVRDQINTFDQRVAELSYDADAASYFAQRYL